MLSAGAKPGSIIFEGKAIGERYQGTAYLFKRSCGKLPYQVSGPILDDYRRVELRGQAPRVDSNCHIIGYADDILEFQLIEPASGNDQLEKSSALAEVKYDGKQTATLRYKDLVVTVDSEPTPDGSDRVPVATGRYGDLSVFSLKVDQNGREEPSANVSIMRLDPATSLPQVILEYFWGGAHCCWVTKIATVDSSGKWHVVDGGVLDGGYVFKDLDANGGNELVSVDNSFLYAFACYACSYSPTRIQKLVGSELRDVTRNPLYQNFLKQRLRDMETNALQSSKDQLYQNGYLAGWVAAKSLVGEFEQAWGTMLAAYDRNSDWLLEECLTSVSLDNCPADKKRRMEFPEALAKHLVDNGYITAQQKLRLVMSSNEQPQVRPWGNASVLEVCSGSGDTVRELVLRTIVGKGGMTKQLGDLVALHDDFAVNANDASINKITCAVTYEANLRAMVGKLAENGQMDIAIVLNNIIRRLGPIISRRIKFTVQPTSKQGQTWVQLLP